MYLGVVPLYYRIGKADGKHGLPQFHGIGRNAQWSEGPVRLQQGEVGGLIGADESGHHDIAAGLDFDVQRIFDDVGIGDKIAVVGNEKAGTGSHYFFAFRQRGQNIAAPGCLASRRGVKGLGAGQDVLGNLPAGANLAEVVGADNPFIPQFVFVAEGAIGKR